MNNTNDPLAELIDVWQQHSQRIEQIAQNHDLSHIKPAPRLFVYSSRKRKRILRIASVTACLVLLAGGLWFIQRQPTPDPQLIAYGTPNQHATSLPQLPPAPVKTNIKSADIKNTTSATANIVEEEPKTEAIPSPQSPTTKPKCGTIECQDWCDNQEILAELNYIIETSHKV
ncbi:MAG: hypothetical protein KBT45_09195 [Bacteroidales bacterium]|nr:hypothetical protein [Candidatus Colimorpha pelethequi]